MLEAFLACNSLVDLAKPFVGELRFAMNSIEHRAISVMRAYLSLDVVPTSEDDVWVMCMALHLLMPAARLYATGLCLMRHFSAFRRATLPPRLIID